MLREAVQQKQNKMAHFPLNTVACVQSKSQDNRTIHLNDQSRGCYNVNQANDSNHSQRWTLPMNIPLIYHEPIDLDLRLPSCDSTLARSNLFVFEEIGPAR